MEGSVSASPSFGTSSSSTAEPWLRTVPGKGAARRSRFGCRSIADIALPRRLRPRQPICRRRGDCRDALHGRKVLVVEDHDDARELVANVLGAAGAEVISAASTGEALECMAGTTPDLLVADLGLPGEDGYTLLRRIRGMNTAETQALPAVALTAYARASDRERALAAGFLRYVIKPVDPAELVTVLASVLETRR